MQTYIPMEKRTVIRIVRSQYLDHVEKKGIVPTLKVLAIAIMSVIIAAAWSHPEASKIFFGTLWSMENHILPKMIAVLASIMASPLIFEHARYILSSQGNKTPHASIGGVPLVEIVGYLFDNGNFPREDVCNKFAISRSDYSEIIEVLDHHNILVRSENNSRVLNSLMPRETVVDILLGGETAKYGNMIGKTFDFFSGVMDKIREKVSPPLPAPRFERRKLG